MKTTENNLVNPYPKLTNKERAEYLLKKWGKVLDYTDTTSVPVSAYYKRLDTAIILESEERWIHPPIDNDTK